MNKFISSAHYRMIDSVVDVWEKMNQGRLNGFSLAAVLESMFDLSYRNHDDNEKYRQWFEGRLSIKDIEFIIGELSKVSTEKIRVFFDPKVIERTVNGKTFLALTYSGNINDTFFRVVECETSTFTIDLFDKEDSENALLNFEYDDGDVTFKKATSDRFKDLEKCRQLKSDFNELMVFLDSQEFSVILETMFNSLLDYEIGYLEMEKDH